MITGNENTPPDTQAVRRCLLNHRRALADIQQVNLEESFQTPQEKVLPLKVNQNAEVRQSQISNLIFYRNPAATLTVLVAGSFLFSLVRCVTSGSSGFSILSTLSFILLGRVGYHVAATILSANTNTKVAGSKSVLRVKKLLTAVVDQAADLHDTYITSANAYQSFIVSGCLWFLGIIGKYLSILSVCYMAFFAVFTIPILVHSYGEMLTPSMYRLIYIFRSKVEKSGLTKRQRSFSFVGLALFVWLCSGWSNRLIGLFMVLLWVRCSLNPDEVRAIQQQTAPLTMSVKKSARRFSSFATKALRS